ncbi:hypothetical protein Tco_1127264 [Tanacetum coccineum]
MSNVRILALAAERIDMLTLDETDLVMQCQNWSDEMLLMREKSLKCKWMRRREASCYCFVIHYNHPVVKGAVAKFGVRVSTTRCSIKKTILPGHIENDNILHFSGSCLNMA